MEITQEQKRKFLAAAEIVENGDMAVIKKLIEMMDFLAEYEAKHQELSDEVKTELTSLRQDFDEQLEQKLLETFNTLDISKEMPEMAMKISMCEEKISDFRSDFVRRFETNNVKKDRAIKDLNEKIERVRNLIPELPDLTSITRKIEEVEKKIPEMPEMEKAEQIRDKLETLKNDERLDKSAIKGLEELIQELRTSISNIPRGGGGGARRNIIQKYSLSSQCDGNTKTFSLPIDTVDVLGVFGTQFPVQYDASGDWTFEGRTLTLGASVGAPATGQTLWALIETL